MSADTRLRLTRTARAAVLVLPLLLAGCPWFTDFKEQPSYQTWQSPRGDSVPPLASPQYSVPRSGTQVPGFAVSYRGVPAALDSMSGLANPRAMGEASLHNGRMYYQTNCAVCHGSAGAGDGPMVQYSPAFAISLLNASARGRSDGYLFGIMRNGRGLMPNYNRIEESDRWDVVNYIRALQGAATVETTPLAPPGVTGTMLPGRTRTAPTRPIPHVDREGRVRGQGDGEGVDDDATATGARAPASARTGAGQGAGTPPTEGTP